MKRTLSEMSFGFDKAEWWSSTQFRSNQSCSSVGPSLDYSELKGEAARLQEISDMGYGRRHLFVLILVRFYR